MVMDCLPLPSCNNLYDGSPCDLRALSQDTRLTLPMIGTTVALNYDLMIQVFVRLPIKSLGRFKSVCTSWNSLISSLEFANLHLQHAINNPKPNPSLQVFICRPSLISPPLRNLQRLYNFKIESIELHNLLYKSASWVCNWSKSAEKLNHKFDEETYPIGSCNGLICFIVGRGYKIFYLWNPATQDSCCIKGPRLLQEAMSLSWGFLYDSLSDDYKILLLGKLNDLTRKTFAILYTLRSNKWKQIECPSDHEMSEFMSTEIPKPILKKLKSLPVLAGESLYWRKKGVLYPNNILAFDLTRDLFEIIPLPKLDPSSYGHFTVDFFICQLRQSLQACLLWNECGPNDSTDRRLYMTVWRMEGRHGTDKVWKCLFKFRGLERCFNRGKIPLLPKLFELKEHRRYLISSCDFEQHLLIHPRGERHHPSRLVILHSNFHISDSVGSVFDIHQVSYPQLTVLQRRWTQDNKSWKLFPRDWSVLSVYLFLISFSNYPPRTSTLNFVILCPF